MTREEMMAEVAKLVASGSVKLRPERAEKGIPFELKLPGLEAYAPDGKALQITYIAGRKT